jgi:hypothetical protein
VHVWDVGQLTGALPGLYPLTRTGVLTVHDPGRLPQLLEELATGSAGCTPGVLVDGHASLRALAETTGRRDEPWIVAVLVGNRSALRDDDHRQLQRIARGGPACGIQLVMLDVPMTVNAPVETVDVDDAGHAVSSMTGRQVTVLLDPPLESAAVTSACHRIADAHEVWRSRIAPSPTCCRPATGAPRARTRGCTPRSASPTAARSRCSWPTPPRTPCSAGPAAPARPTCCWA